MKQVTVLLTLAVLVIVKTKANCPDDPGAAILECSKEMMAFFESADKQSRSKLCPIAYTALDCVENILNDCADSPLLANSPMTLDAMLENVRQGRLQVDHECQNTTTIEQCPDPQGMQTECSQIAINFHTAQNSEARLQLCPLAIEELACYENLIEQCRGHESFVSGQELEAAIQHWREQLHGLCGSGETSTRPSGGNEDVDNNIVTGNHNDGNDQGSSSATECPVDYQQQIMQCVSEIPMSEIRNQADIGRHCGAFERYIQCVEGIITVCEDKRLVQNMISSLNIEQTRQQISIYCGHGETPLGPATGNGEINNNIEIGGQSGGIDQGSTSADECPSDFEQQLIQCGTEMQRVIMQKSQDISLVCAAYERGMHCAERIVAICGEAYIAHNMASSLNLKAARQQMSQICGHGETPLGPATGNGEINNNIEIGGHSGGIDQGSTSADECPSDFEQQLVQCGTEMQRVIMQEYQDIGLVCAAYERGMHCAEQIVAMCGETYIAQNMASSLNLENARQHISQICGHGETPTGPETGNEEINSTTAIGGPNGGSDQGSSWVDECPTDYQKQLMDCQTDMHNAGMQEPLDISRICVAYERSIHCLENIVTVCGDKPLVQNLVSSLNMEQIRQQMSMMCGVGGTPSRPLEFDNNTKLGTSGEPQNISSCPADYYVKMTQCSEGLEDFLEAEDRASECKTAHASLDCYADLFHQCQNNPEMKEIADSFDLDTLRSSLSLFC